MGCCWMRISSSRIDSRARAFRDEPQAFLHREYCPRRRIDRCEFSFRSTISAAIGVARHPAQRAEKRKQCAKSGRSSDARDATQEIWLHPDWPQVIGKLGSYVALRGFRRIAHRGITVAFWK